MKAVVIQEHIIQPDITPKDLQEHWMALKQLPGVDEVEIVAPGNYPSVEELGRLTGDAEALFGVWIGPDLLNREFLDQHPHLRYVATLGHGWETFDTDLTRSRGVTVTNTIYGAQTIAEYAFALLMEVCHHISVQDHRIRMIDWTQPRNDAQFCKAIIPQVELYQKTIGIVGLGEIGYALARMAYGFGMHVVGFSTHRKTGEKYAFIEQVDTLEELLQKSDVVSLHLPHTPATEHILNARTIAMMRDGAILINTARGALIDEQALADAMVAHQLRAAALDVLTEEPPRHGTPLLTAPNVTITGHIAWLTRESRLRAIDMAVDNFACYLRGQPKSVID